MAAAQELAERHGLEDERAALDAARQGPAMRDPLVGGLLQREAVADFLEALALAMSRAAKAAEPSKVVKDQQKVEAIHSSKGAKG